MDISAWMMKNDEIDFERKMLAFCLFSRPDR